jgi:endoglucanase
MPIDKRFAGNYSRPMGHPDTACYFHPSTGHNGGKKASPRGWYDAGDYNKYVVNAGVTVGTLMQLHELFPDYLPDGALNIPESGNRINDLVDEIRYELDWLLSMQDADGGVFVKVSNLKHDPFAMPDKTLEKRYIIGKSTGSSLCFSAILAQASRIMKPVNTDYAAYMLQCSQRAWNWAIQNPNKVFRNPPDVHTGEYFEDDFGNNFFWAACELYTTTSSPVYYHEFQKYSRPLDFSLGNWRNFLPNLGYFSLISQQSQLPENEKTIIKKRLYNVADSLMERMKKIPYRIAVDNFTWGSNSDILDAAIIFAEAYHYSKERKYLNAAIENTDYVLGKNATSYSFVTGFGAHSPKDPHHRLSASDGIEGPIPGFLVGGPNSGHNDANKETLGVKYKYNEPARSYMDEQNNWASNEVAINWNAPLVFITGFLENSMENEQRKPANNQIRH